MAKQPDWFGNLFNYLLGYFFVTILGSLYYWWIVPIAGILAGDWTVFYKSFVGFNVLPPAVQSVQLSIN